MSSRRLPIHVVLLGLFAALLLALRAAPRAAASSLFLGESGFVLDRPLMLGGVDVGATLSAMHSTLQTAQADIAELKLRNAQLQSNLTATTQQLQELQGSTAGAFAAVNGSLSLHNEQLHALTLFRSNTEAALADQGGQLSEHRALLDQAAANNSRLAGATLDLELAQSGLSVVVDQTRTEAQGNATALLALTERVTSAEGALGDVQILQGSSPLVTAVLGQDSRMTFAEGAATTLTDRVTVLEDQVVSINATAIADAALLAVHSESLKLVGAVNSTNLQATVAGLLVTGAGLETRLGKVESLTPGSSPLVTAVLDQGGRLSAAEASVADQGNRLTSTVSDVTSLTGRMDNAETTAAALTTRVDTTEGDLTALGIRVTSAEASVADHAGRLTTAEGNLTSLSGRVTTAEGELTALDTRVTDAEDAAATLTGRVTSAETAAAALSTRVDTAEGNLTSLSSRVDAAEATAAVLTTRVGTTEDDVTALEVRVSTAEGKVASLESRATDAEGELTSLDTRMTAAESADAAMIMRVATAESATTTLTTRVASTEGDVTALGTRLTAVEGDVTGLTARLTAAEQLSGTATPLTTAVLDHSARLTSAESAATALTGRVTVLENQVTALNATAIADAAMLAVHSESLKLVGAVNSTNLQATVAGLLVTGAGLETRLGKVESLTPGSSPLVTAVLDQGTRLSTAEAGVSDQGARLTSTESDVTSLTGRMDNAETTAAALTTRVVTAEGDLTALTARVLTAEGSVSDQGTRLTALEDLSGSPSSALYTAVTGLQTTVNGQGTRLTTAEGGLTALGSRIAAAEADAATLSGRVTAAEDAATTLTGRVASAETAATALTARVDTAEGNLTSLTSRVDAAEADAAALTGRVAAAEGDATTLAGRVTAAEGAATTLTVRVSTAEGGLTDLTSRVSAAENLDGAATALTTAVLAVRDFTSGTPLYTTVTGYNTRLTAIENLSGSPSSTLYIAVTGLQSTVGDHGTRLTAAESAATTLTGRVAAAETAATALTTRVSAAENLDGTATTLTTTVIGLRDLTATTAPLVSRFLTAESRLASLNTTVGGYGTRLTAAEGTATTLTGRVTAAESAATALDTRVSSAESAATTLTSRVSAAESAATALATRVSAAENLNGVPTTLTTAMLAVRDLTSGTPLYTVVDNLRTLTAGTTLTDAVIGLRDLTATSSTLVTAISNMRNLVPASSTLVTRLLAAESDIDKLEGMTAGSSTLITTVAGLQTTVSELSTRLTAAETLGSPLTTLTTTLTQLRDLGGSSALATTVRGMRDLTVTTTTLASTLLAIRDFTPTSYLGYLVLESMRSLTAGSPLTNAVLSQGSRLTDAEGLSGTSTLVTAVKQLQGAMSFAVNLTNYNTLATRLSVLEVAMQPSTVLGQQVPATVAVTPPSRGSWFTLSEAQWPSITILESGQYLVTGQLRVASLTAGQDGAWLWRLVLTTAGGVVSYPTVGLGTTNYQQNIVAGIDRQTSINWAGPLNAGDKLRLQYQIQGTGTAPVAICNDANGVSQLYAIKLVGSGLTPTAFTATPTCPPYARITLGIQSATATYASANDYYRSWEMTDASLAPGNSASPAVPAGCPSPFGPFVQSSGGVTITRSGEYRISIVITYSDCVGPYSCHGWIELVGAAAGGKGTVRVVSYMGAGANYIAATSASLQLSDADLPAFVAVRLNSGTVSIQGINKRVFQVERLADYTPANRQVEPSPVPTDYAQQLASLSAANSSLSARMTDAESALAVTHVRLGEQQLTSSTMLTVATSATGTIALGTITPPISGRLNVEFTWNGLTCSVNFVFTGNVFCQLKDVAAGNALQTPVFESTLTTNERFTDMSNFHRDGWTSWTVTKGRAYTLSCSHTNLNNQGTQMFGNVFAKATMSVGF